MPKTKTNSSAKKRFRLTASGKIRRNKAFKSHLLTHKSKRRKRSLRKSVLVKPVDEKRMFRLLGRH